ncbi:CaCA family Na+/Ca+ antiporter [Nitzschia inconspicua]|uniref:CaCA family Na+/Ca+ antiporter n=1 Tax=Nitzschia inconspicua TaxID=303405 RepID=A0A9K3Q267_9STRA|nr:CaCA family Na+/Ca+ antiporter [Nitzschia inconspicua]
MDDTAEETVPTAPWWIWTILCTISAASFWCQAIVTEERLVPALNVIADYYKIPSDIAGATLMAAGASSPELFSSLVALFITHSSLGLGTIVGSEIFNQLIICAGSVFASKTGKLILDKAIVTREVGFYALGIMLLYFALQDAKPLPENPDGVKHIFISFWEATLVFSGYILYVIVCANMDAIVKCVSNAQKAVQKTITTSGTSSYGSMTSKKDIDLGPMEYVTAKRNLSEEPEGNWKAVDYYVPRISTDAALSQVSGAVSLRRGSIANSIRTSTFSHTHNILRNFIATEERPTEIHNLYDVQMNDFKNELSCFLFQKSLFYTMSYFGSNAWQLRWFTISPDKVISVPDRGNPDEHRMRYPHFKAIEVDENRLIINIVNPIEGKHDHTLMAPSKPIFDKVVEAFETYMKQNATVRGPPLKPENDDEAFVDIDFDGADDYEELIQFPADGSNIEVIFWVLLFPLRLMMHFTLPDVRSLDENGEPTSSIGKAFFSTFMCLIWLVAGSYAMVASLEALAALLDIPDAVIGFTVSAAGTSLPNYVASKVAAENGFGNQAVSNAFGSNTFNIMVGLGLPWMLYTSFGTHFEPYHGLKDDQILESIIILAMVLAIFLVFMFFSDFVIQKWHGVVFLLLYVAYLTLAIVQVLIK